VFVEVTVADQPGSRSRPLGFRSQQQSRTLRTQLIRTAHPALVVFHMKYDHLNSLSLEQLELPRIPADSANPRMSQITHMTHFTHYRLTSVLIIPMTIQLNLRTLVQMSEARWSGHCFFAPLGHSPPNAEFGFDFRVSVATIKIGGQKSCTISKQSNCNFDYYHFNYFDRKLLDNFSHESDVTSLQDPFTSRPYKTPFCF